MLSLDYLMNNIMHLNTHHPHLLSAKPHLSLGILVQSSQKDLIVDASVVLNMTVIHH